MSRYIQFFHFSLSTSGHHGSRTDDHRVLRPHHLRLPDEDRLHGLRHRPHGGTAHLRRRQYHLNVSGKGQDHEDRFRQHRRLLILHLPHLRHATHAWRKAQVLHLTRGVHLRRAQPLPRHRPDIHVHPDDPGQCEGIKGGDVRFLQSLSECAFFDLDEGFSLFTWFGEHFSEGAGTHKSHSGL